MLGDRVKREPNAPEIMGRQSLSRLAARCNPEDMNVRKYGGVVVVLAAGVALAAAPSAQTLAMSTGSSQVNIGCILDSLSANPKGADCYPAQIPTPTGARAIGFGPGQLPTGSFGGIQNT